VSRVFLGLGSNVGDRLHYLSKAVEKLALIGTVVRLSSVYETEAVGMGDARTFYNMSVEVETSLSPEDLLKKVKVMEHDIGRTVGTHMKPREIDIDVLLYGQTVMHSDVFRVPHAGIPERRFVLEPLNEIAGDVIHPTLRQTIRQLLQQCSDGSRVVRTLLSVNELHSI